MDADGWDRSDDPRAMIASAGDRVSARKWRLFMAAAAGEATRHQDVRTIRDAIAFAGRTADGLTAAQPAPESGRLMSNWAGTPVPLLLRERVDAAVAAEMADRLGRWGLPAERGSGWLREVLGNPFRWVRWEDDWLTRTAHTLAADAYARGRFDTLPVLADALDDAGCDNDELLAHLRGPGPHARGCWALDVVLGKV